MISKAHVTTSDRCRACGGKLTLTGTKMNVATWGRHRARENLRRAGYDEIVACDVCGWTWWVHHEK